MLSDLLQQMKTNSIMLTVTRNELETDFSKYKPCLLSRQFCPFFFWQLFSTVFSIVPSFVHSSALAWLHVSLHLNYQIQNWLYSSRMCTQNKELDSNFKRTSLGVAGKVSFWLLVNIFWCISSSCLFKGPIWKIDLIIESHSQLVPTCTEPWVSVGKLERDVIISYLTNWTL